MNKEFFKTIDYMPDITKCLNEECHKKLRCYRYTSLDSYIWQSYAKFPGGDECQWFWESKR